MIAFLEFGGGGRVFLQDALGDALAYRRARGGEFFEVGAVEREPCVYAAFAFVKVFFGEAVGLQQGSGALERIGGRFLHLLAEVLHALHRLAEIRVGEGGEFLHARLALLLKKHLHHFFDAGGDFEAFLALFPLCQKVL